MTPDDPDLIAWYAAIAAAPADGTLRQVFADWLEETAGEVKCPVDGRYSSQDGLHWQYDSCGPDSKWVLCEKCSGTGSVSNGRAELAAGYRAMGSLGIYPSERHGNAGEGGLTHWFQWINENQHAFGRATGHDVLPEVWCEKLIRNPLGHRCAQATRRQAEDAAALAFARLTESERRKILRDAGVLV